MTEGNVPRIFRVEIGLPAYRAGLRDGDYIRAINGRDTARMGADEIEELILRSGQDHEIELLVGNSDADADADFSF